MDFIESFDPEVGAGIKFFFCAKPAIGIAKHKAINNTFFMFVFIFYVYNLSLIVYNLRLKNQCSDMDAFTTNRK